jgi:hypothetical protein
MNVAGLHPELERRSPNGVGAAIALSTVESLARAAITTWSRPVPGINERIPLPLSPNVEAAFTTDATSFNLDRAAHTVSLNVSVWLHVAGNPAQRIATLTYAVTQAPLGIIIDQTTLTVSFEPRGMGTIAPNPGTVVDPQAVIAAGYITSTGAPDLDRFNQEVYFPFLWNVSQGLVRSVIRSLPVPQPLAAMTVIRPVTPVKAELVDDYLLVWSELATAVVPDCAEQPSPIPPSSLTWQLRPGSPQPSSPFDTLNPPFAIYYAAQPVLNWHSAVLKPAVLVSQSGGSVVGWRFDAAIGLDTLLVELVPAANGGSIEASAALKVVGVASAWLNLPCGPVGLVSGAVQADASATAGLTMTYDASSYRIDTVLDAHGAINGGSVVISTGGALGIFGSILGDLVNWLVHLGIIHIDTQFSQRGSTAIWDAGRLNATSPGLEFEPRMRIGDRSALIAVFERQPDD